MQNNHNDMDGLAETLRVESEAIRSLTEHNMETIIKTPDAEARISEDALTDWLMYHEDHFFTGTKADARRIARAMLAGPFIEVRCDCGARHVLADPTPRALELLRALLRFSGLLRPEDAAEINAARAEARKLLDAFDAGKGGAR